MYQHISKSWKEIGDWQYNQLPEREKKEYKKKKEQVVSRSSSIYDDYGVNVSPISYSDNTYNSPIFTPSNDDSSSSSSFDFGGGDSGGGGASGSWD